MTATPCYSHVIYGPTVDVIVADGLPNTLTNVVIPYTGKPKLLVRPVYADDGVFIKYYQYDLTISATVYLPVATLADIEAEVARIKKILGVPGLQLKMYPVGIGKTPVVNGSIGVFGTDFVPDLTYGPYPTELSVTPAVTNEAIDIEWKVTTCITHCETVYAKNLVQFVTELDIDVDHEGNVSFIQRAIYEASSRITDISAFNATMDSFVRLINRSFQGMTQTQSTHQSMDGRKLTFEARFAEIPSDSAFHPYVRNIDFVDDLSSDLMGGGFYKWNRKFTAKITLPARIHKAWAWVIYKSIVKERLRNLQQLAKEKAKDFDKPANQDDDTDATKNWYLCIKMKLTNPIYTRTMSFESEYIVCTSLDKLLSKTLICSRVNTKYALDAGGNIVDTVDPASTLSEQWVVWDKAFINTLTGMANYKTEVPVNYSQCQTSSVQTIPLAPRIFGQSILPLEIDPDVDPDVLPLTSPGEATAGQTVYQNEPSPTVDPRYSWIDYNNGFEIIETNDNMQASYLQSTPNAYYQNASPETGPLKRTVGFQINNNTSNTDSGYEPSETVSRGIASYKIRMKGYAIRAGSAIPTPVLTAVGASPVERTDVARMSHKQIAQSDTTPIYLCMWDIVYNVSTDIHAANIMDNIKSTGHPGYYA